MQSSEQALPTVVLAVTFDVDTGDPNIIYCGYDAGTAKDYASWAVQNEANINLGYVFVHPEPTVIFRQDNMGPPAMGPVREKPEGYVLKHPKKHSRHPGSADSPSQVRATVS